MTAARQPAWRPHTLDEARHLREKLRQAGKRLVFTNGHFDLLHVGHLDYLQKARALGDALMIGVNGDRATRQLKGKGRPFVPALQRARLLAGLRCVDAVLVFEADTADEVLRALQPDVYAKGGDYAHKPLPERAAVEALGGRVALIDFLRGHSTSALIKKIRNA